MVGVTATIAAPQPPRNTASKTKRPRTQQLSRRAAVYVRISKDHTGEELGVQRQEEDARAIIEARGWILAGIYSDNSISASDSRKFRPGYAELQRDYAAGLFDALVVWDLDRLTRQPRQLEDWIDAAEARGLALVTTNGEADLTTDAGRLFARIRLAVARAEIERKSARHKRALKQHAEAGRIPHGPRLFGYTPEGDIAPDEAMIVIDLFERFYGGESLRSLVRLLEERNVPTRSGRPWNTRTVRDMLTNARYAGWAVYQKEIATRDGVRVRGQWEPLIGEDMFDVVGAKLSDPTRKTNRVGTDRRYIGSALYLCAQCDAPVSTVNGGKYFCAGHLTREHRYVDEFVIDLVAARLAQPDLSAALAPTGDDMKPVVAESKRLRDRLAKIDADYDDGVIDGQRWRSAKDKVAAQLRELDKKLIASSGGAALGRIIDAPDPAQAFRDASLMAQRAVIGALVTVKLRRQPKGRMKRDAEGRARVNPATVLIDWKR
jgi:DNA invertase Pin-like site-specific DNA recombinase